MRASQQGRRIGQAATGFADRGSTGHSPSKADIEMTREVQKAAAALGVTLHDYVILGRTPHASLKSLGLI